MIFLPDVSGSDALGEALRWIAALLMGPLATAVCVLAVAALGLVMMFGRIPVRRGVAVVTGIFVIIGAPLIAGAAMSLTTASRPTVSIDVMTPAAPAMLPPPPPYDPYAGASMPQR